MKLRNSPDQTCTASSVLPATWLNNHTAGTRSNDKEKRFAYYCRYSAKVDRESSIERQIANCDLYAKRLGAVPATGRHLYIDRSTSGAYMFNRPALKELLEDVRKGLFDLVIVEDLDRLSRDIGDLGTMHRELEYRRIELHAAVRGKVGNAEIALFGLLGSEQRLKLAQITTQGLWIAATQGRSPTGPCYGYRRSPRGPGLCDIDEVEGEVVQRIFRLYDEGLSPTAIAALLNAEGIKSPGGSLWTSNVIYGTPAKGNGLLRNPRYRGVLVYGKAEKRIDPLSGSIKANLRHSSQWIVKIVPEWILVDPEIWDRVQIALAASSVHRERRKPSSKEEFIFKGRMFCTCGAPMHAPSPGARRTKTLRCSAAAVNACEQKGMMLHSHVQRHVLNLICEAVVGEEAEIAFAGEFQAECDRIRTEVVLEKARREKEIAGLARRLKASYDDQFTAGFTHQYVAELRREMSKEIAEHEAALERLPRLDEIPDPAPEAIPEFRSQIAKLALRVPFIALSEQDQLLVQKLRALVQRIVFEKTPEGFRIQVEGHLAGIFTIGSASAPVLPTRTLDRTFPAPSRGPRIDLERYAELNRDIEQGRYALTDPDWASVEAILGPLPAGWSLPPRLALEAALLHGRTGLPMYRMPPRYRGTRVWVALETFGRIGSLKRAVDHLVAQGSAAVEGLDIALLSRWMERGCAEGANSRRERPSAKLAEEERATSRT